MVTSKKPKKKKNSVQVRRVLIPTIMDRSALRVNPQNAGPRRPRICMRRMPGSRTSPGLDETRTTLAHGTQALRVISVVKGSLRPIPELPETRQPAPTSSFCE